MGVMCRVIRTRKKGCNGTEIVTTRKEEVQQEDKTRRYDTEGRFVLYRFVNLH